MTEERTLDLICMGRTCVDLYGEQEGARLEDVQSFRKYVGGSSTNIAVGTARLGVKVAMLSRVGDEHMGRFVREMLAGAGVDVGHLKTDPDRLTPYCLLAVREVDHFPRIFVYENSADMAIDEDDIDPEFIASSKALLVSGTHFSRASAGRATRRAMQAAKEAGTKIVLDIDYRPNFWDEALLEKDVEASAAAKASEAHQSVMSYCDLIVGTEEEVRIAGGSSDTGGALRKIRNLSAATIVLKTGAMGAIIFGGEIPDDLEDGLRIPGYPVEVFNSTGAGDAFMSGFLRCWLDGEPLERCGELANACGALVVSRHGCSPAMPTSEEIEYYLPRANKLHRPREDGWLDHLHRATTRQSPPDDLYVLAFDHRWQVEELADEAGADYERLYTLKDLIGQAFRRVNEARGNGGVLIDDIYGATVLEGLTGSGVWISRAIEVARSRPVEFAGGPNVAAVLRTWPQEHVAKCMVYCHPQEEPDVRKVQEERIVQLSDACVRDDRQFLIEIQAPRDMSYSENDVALLLDRFYELGVRPDWWKLPPNPHPTVWNNIGDVVHHHDPYCAGLLMLGLGITQAKLAESLAAASNEPLCKGFAVGRTIFADQARRWLANESSDEELVDSVAANYKWVIDLWEESAPRSADEAASRIGRT